MYPSPIGSKLARWLFVSLVAATLSGSSPAAAQVAPGPETDCLQVGAARCLSVASGMVEAVQALMATDVGPALLRTAADRRVRVRITRLDRGLEGQYSPATRTVAIARRLARRAVQVQALALAHELQHAGERPEDEATTEQCFASEEAAFRLEARVWPQLWGGQLPPDVDEYYREANDLVRQLARDPEGFARDIRDLYQDDCGEPTDDEEDE